MLKKMALYAVLVIFLSISYLLFYLSAQEPFTLNEDSRANIKGDFIELSHGHVLYELKGPEEAPVIIFVHGAGSGNYAWDKNFQFFADHGYRVLRYDLYGRGFSDRPEVIYDTTLFVNQLEELTNKLDLKPPYTLVSVSMGSSITIPYCNKYPQKVNNLVLTDPASLGQGDIAWYLRKPVISSLLMSLYWYPRAVDKQMKEFYDSSKVKEYRTKSLQQLKYKGLKRGMLSSWQNMLPLNLSKQLIKIGKSNKRVMLVWGKQDPLIPVATKDHYMKYIPQTIPVIIDEAGHLANYEKADKFNKELLTFLKNEK